MKLITKKLVSVIVIILLILGMSFILYNNVMDRQKEQAWELLKDSAKSVKKEITMKFKDDITGLGLIANAMEQEGKIDPSQIGFLHLDSYRKTTLFSRIDIIYQDNTILLEDNTRIPLRDDVSFEEIYSRGNHMSSRMTDNITNNESVYYFKPVDIGDVKAIVVGVVDTTTLSKMMRPTIFNGKTVCCLIDANDGNFIMDNWHKKLGNAYSMKDRQKLKEYEEVDLKFEIKNQKEGLIAFKSNTNGKDIYMYYLPIKMFNWNLEVFTQEDVIFENLYHTRKILFIAGGVETVLLGLYFLWNLIAIKRLERSKSETAHQLDISNTLIQCVTELSSDKDVKVSIGYILKIINNFYKADTTYIYELDFVTNKFINTYHYIENFTKVKMDKEVYINPSSNCLKCFNDDKIYYVSCLENNECSKECQMLQKYGIDNFLAVPLTKQETLKGFIGLTNIRKSFDEKEFLTSVRYFITNRLSIQKTQGQLKYLSYNDLLTSMFNRNKYIEVLKSLKNQTLYNVGCAYIDLNGLKKINDGQGHEQGDKIISETAYIIKKFFLHKAYRVGGDEFVVINTDISEHEFNNKINELTKNLEREKISASIGCLWIDSCNDLEMVLQNADKLMYEEKKNYHRQTND